jgi:hypothetical protein
LGGQNFRVELFFLSTNDFLLHSEMGLAYYTPQYDKNLPNQSLSDQVMKYQSEIYQYNKEKQFQI